MIDLYEKFKPNWLMRISIINVITLLFVAFKHETFEQAMFRFIFVNIFTTGIFILSDIITYFALKNRE